VVPPPWKIEVVEPIALRPESERRRALEAAGLNTFPLRSEDAGCRSSFRLAQAVRDAHGFADVVTDVFGRSEQVLGLELTCEPAQLRFEARFAPRGAFLDAATPATAASRGR
jgi:tryptophanase